MRYLLTVLLLLGFIAIVVDNNGKNYWENVGPQWACVLNPAKYQFCEQETE